MKSTNALMRENQTGQTAAKTVAPIANDVAAAVSGSWMNIITAETALAQMGRGIVTWRAAPPSQNAMASMLCNMITKDMSVFCIGFQSYAYQIAAGENLADVMCQYIGKQFAKNIVQMSVEDVGMNLAKGRMNIVAMHVENASGWNDLRAISSAAIKANAPIVVLASTSMSAPEGVAIEIANDWNSTVTAVRDAINVVSGNGSIRVVAFNDETPSVIERAMMDATGMTPDAWGESARKNNDGAEIAANAAYQAPVESF